MSGLPILQLEAKHIPPAREWVPLKTPSAAMSGLPILQLEAKHIPPAREWVPLKTPSAAMSGLPILQLEAKHTPPAREWVPLKTQHSGLISTIRRRAKDTLPLRTSGTDGDSSLTSDFCTRLSRSRKSWRQIRRRFASLRIAKEKSAPTCFTATTTLTSLRPSRLSGSRKVTQSTQRSRSRRAGRSQARSQLEKFTSSVIALLASGPLK